MKKVKIGTFEIMILIVGLIGGLLGFRLINNLYLVDEIMTWGMLNSIFLWLILMTIFIMMSVTVEVSRKHYEETKAMHALIRKQQKEIETEQKEISSKIKQV